MRVVIAGGHGQIALRLERLLAARGDQAVGIIRKPEQAADLRDSSAEPVVLDLETAELDAVAEVLQGADAAVFAAGAGPGSGSARKDTVDRGAAALFAEAAERAGVRRHLQVSAMGLDRADEPGMDEVFSVYLKAKAAAEDDLRARDLDWTILRPGRLTDDPGTGQVHLAESVDYGTITRDDVAAVLVALLDESRTVGRTLELVEGHTPIEEALERI
ncbi:NAD(P)H-binding protein [Amycolatopsis albispora]|uniref:NAD-dependent dehydratase n=1 Tax=Amycolatopsis albispora TaxID=1804986 RepID=A0A344LD87_9PSEU|nr:NAD(P)H-binding protein [Amycolatopsis albispora]AXB46011.1 NAD-dependent dehydratase [Amycolatopsis albispora]